MHRTASLAALLLATAASSARAQTNIDATNKFSWQENTGWMNWRDANDGAQGVRDRTTFLQGSIWCENIGWINVGDGSPKNGSSYANINGTDFGVNLNALTGDLSGYAWGENVGWINFRGGALATPAKPARLDAKARRLHGYAWGENIGWINLDHATHFVAFLCPADFNQDGFVTGDDFDEYVAVFEAGEEGADFNGDGFVTGDDFDAFVQAFENGC